MLIHVLPGSIHGNPLALTNELNAIRYRHALTGLADTGDDSETSTLARQWAQPRQIPTVRALRPHLLIIALDLAKDWANQASLQETPLENMAKDAWQRALTGINPRPSPLRALLDLFQRRMTIWVNTTCDIYAGTAHP